MMIIDTLKTYNGLAIPTGAATALAAHFLFRQSWHVSFFAGSVAAAAAYYLREQQRNKSIRYNAQSGVTY